MSAASAAAREEAVREEAAEERVYRHRFLIALAVALASMMQVIDTSIVNVAIPHMMGNLGATVEEISWVSTGYIIAAACVIPLTGWLAGFFGRKRYFVSSIVIFTAASFLCGTARSLEALVLWRVVQGIGGGALIATSQAILWESFPREEVGTGMAFFGVAVMVGPTLGPTLGGWLTDQYSWPWIFFINVPVGALAVAMITAYVHDRPEHTRKTRVDGAGIGLLVLAVASVQLMLERGERLDWFDSPLVVALAVVSAVAAVLLVVHELRVDEPAVNLRLLSQPQFTAGSLMGVVLGAGLFGSVFVLPIFLQSMLHMTAWQTGLVILPGAVASAVSMGMVGRLSAEVDNRLLIIIGSALFGIGMWQLSTITSLTGTDDLFWPLIWRGLGLGLIFVPLTNLTLLHIAPPDLGQATGLNNFFRQLGGSFSIAAIASLLTRFVSEEHAILAAQVSAYSPVARGRLAAITQGMMANGMDAQSAGRAALRALDGQIRVQANVIAFEKIYLLSGALLLAALPLLLLFREGKPSATGSRGAPIHAE
ncbi:MAG TPA: DHA2 family efflux MFS transporter permease subunit [Longimicrobiales bacterium]|nr:DHA2 family efflux MFS transporter permease subunit [Longimicrobiales bacterium]